ncbi:tyrosine-type recombinase/integrase [Dietzia maris]|uniref:Site-specific integrase n=1 Tax=Dietzia maris TaxID=37915 RepID=A0ABT8H006_9ACTN|nr:site-specific integrase [Dietzia maris]MCZ4539856.1 site-specific integrase [Dietzia maris]MDN4505304.1 site-specific integrase [Dietzia maris]
MARRRQAVGELGEIRVKNLGPKKFRAFVYIRCRDDKLRQVQADGTSATDARAKVTLAAKRRAGVVADGIGPQSKLSSVIEEWVQEKLAAGEIAIQTAETYRSDARTMGGKAGIADMRLEDCTAELVQGWLKNVSSTKPGLAKRYKVILRGAFALADERGANLDRPDPVGSVRLVRPKRTAPRAATLDDLQAVRRRIAAWQAGEDRTSRGGRPRWQHTGHALDVMLATGCRIGELLALRWDDVDLASTPPTVTISGTLVRLEGTKAEGGGLIRQPMTKTSSGYRTVALPRFAVDALMAVKVNAPRSDQNLVFVSVAGGPIDPHNWRRRWREIRGDEYAWITPHTFRRTVATLVDREVDTESAAAVLGHAGTAVTKKHYVERASVAPDMSEVLDRLGPVKEQS